MKIPTSANLIFLSTQVAQELVPREDFLAALETAMLSDSGSGTGSSGGGGSGRSGASPGGSGGADSVLVTDTMRLVDLLLVLLWEGRRKLSTRRAGEFDVMPGMALSGGLRSGGGLGVGMAGVMGLGSGWRRDVAHRHLIEAIRNKDIGALVEAIESGAFDVNYTDDVGQTLLNWTAAFGSPEMVAYLCGRGAEPNKGVRSPSLHYAACFGRPEIVKILLHYGGDPNLRDEDRKLAIDKARERPDADEGHREVVNILTNPEGYHPEVEEMEDEDDEEDEDEEDEDEEEEDQTGECLLNDDDDLC